MKKTSKILALLMAAVISITALCITSSASSAYTDMEDMKASWTSNITAENREFWDDSKSWTWYSYQFYENRSALKYRGTLTFELNKKYSVASFFIYNHDTNRNVADIEFYGDGKLLFSKRGMNYNDGEYISFSVKKVKELTVRLTRGYYFLLTDGKFQKNTLKLSDTELKVDVKGSANLNYTYKDGADKKITGKKVKFSTENSKIAKVSSKGKIVGVKPGVTNVSVTSPDGLTEKCKVIVLTPKVTGVKLVSATSNSVTLEWDKIDGANKYEIGFYDPDLEEYEKLTTSKTNKVTLKKLDSNTEYTFMIRGCVKDGDKLYKGAFCDDFKVKTSK